MKRLSLSAVLTLFLARAIAAQAGGHTLFGDVKIDESEANGLKPLAVEVLLYSEGGTLVARQTVQSNGRYRFLDLRDGIYMVAIEIESLEIARLRVHVSSPFKNDFRQDIELQWKERSPTVKAGVVSVRENYVRSATNETIFRKAASELEKAHYEQAIPLL